MSAASHTATAQPALGVEQAPTRSVYHPGLGIADSAETTGAAQVVINPASLGELRGYAAGLRHTETSSDTPWSGRGTALYGALPLPAPHPLVSFLSRIKLGGAIEVLRPGSLTMGKLTLAAALRVSSWLSVGVSYAHLFAPNSPFDHVDTMDVGARLRLGRFVAAGFVVRDLTGPALGALGDLSLQRVYLGELLLRPLGSARFELAVGAQLGERLFDAQPRGRLWVNPLPGLGIGAEVSALVNSPGGRPADWRASLGLSFDFGRIGTSAFGFFGNSTATPGMGHPGGSLALRLSEDRSASFIDRIKRGRRVIEIKPGDGSYTRFLRMLEQLRRIETMRDVEAVLINLESGTYDGWAGADELRAALLRLRQAGKRVFAYSRSYTTTSYYAATAAEKIYLHPDGTLGALGVSVTRLFVKDLLTTLGVHAEFFYLGAYKSAHEMFSRSEPSPEDTEQTQAILDDAYTSLLRAVQEGRHLTEERAAALIDRGPLPPPRAVDSGAIDALSTREELDAALEKDLGHKPKLGPYTSDGAREGGAARTIAVIPITGELGDGDGLSDSTPASWYESFIKEAAADPTVRAIVLRVNCPGGYANASELLRLAVIKARKSKPVICSFGAMATSGAYDFASHCDRIFTNPNTMTGSIGAFISHVDVSSLMTRLGVHTQTFQRGQNAETKYKTIGYRPYDKAQRALLMDLLRYFYDRFVASVAAGRNLKPYEVYPIAGGHVFSGTRGHSRKLADEIGGLVEAVLEAQRRAKLGDKLSDDVTIRYISPAKRSLLNRLLGVPFLSPAPSVLSEAEADADSDDKAHDSALLSRFGALWQQVPRLLLLLEEKPLSVYWGPVLN